VKVLGFRIRRLTFPAQNLQAVFDRMQAERERIAKQYRSEGQEEAAKIESDARLSEANLLATAKKDAEEVKGAADADATRIYAAAFGKDPDFYRFVRSLETYRKILGANSTLVIPSDSPLLEVMKDPDRFIRKSGAPSPEGGGK
jgi:membrane protease subunit HflC